LHLVLGLMYLFNQVDFFILNYAGIIILMSRILALQVSLYPKKKTYQFCYIVIQIHCTKGKCRLATERSRGPSPGGLGICMLTNIFLWGPVHFQQFLLSFIFSPSTSYSSACQVRFISICGVLDDWD